jgi:uncharacterized coiled-coil DUF342 family protein
MTDDIVKRLREAGECPTPLRAYLARAVVLQAADEIEDLRFQLSGTHGELGNALSRERTLLREQEDCRIGADNLEAEIELLRSTVTDCRIEIERLRAERDEANANAKLYRDERDEAIIGANAVIREASALITAKIPSGKASAYWNAVDQFRRAETKTT